MSITIIKYGFWKTNLKCFINEDTYTYIVGCLRWGAEAMNLPKYSKPVCTLVRRMKIPKSDSENYNDDTFSTAGRLKESVLSRLSCKPGLLKRIKFGELNRQHSFGRKEGRYLLVIPELLGICWKWTSFWDQQGLQSGNRNSKNIGIEVWRDSKIQPRNHSRYRRRLWHYALRVS